MPTSAPSTASLRLRVRRRARREVATVVTRAADRLPGEGLAGPAPVRALAARALVAESRRALRGSKDPEEAERLLSRVLADPSGDAGASAAWAALAEARRTAGDLPGARDAADRAVAAEPVAFAALLERHRVLGPPARGDESIEPDDERLPALQAVLAHRPANRTELREAFAALRTGPRAEVELYRQRLEDWGLYGQEQRLAAAAHEIAVVTAPAAELDHAVADAAERLEHPVPVVARALAARGEWERLAAFADAHPVDPASSPVQLNRAGLELRRAAGTALKAGRARLAQRLAAHALALVPDDLWARDTWTAARDAVDVVDRGWAYAPRHPSRRYLPRPDAVVSVLAQSLPHTSGGYATRTHGVLTGLAARGWDVAAVTRPGFPYDRWPAGDPRTVAPVDVVDGIAYHRLLTSARKYPQHPLRDYVDGYATRLEQLVRAHRPALVHASSFHVNGLAAQSVAAKLGVPFVYEMRGLEELMKVSQDPAFATSERHAFTASLETGIAQHADRVFVITAALRDLMVERGVPAERLVVLPNGVHADRFEPRPRDAELAAELGVTGRTVIGYAGGLVHYEGLDLLLEALRILTAVRDDLHLVVVGDGPEEGRLHALAEQLGLTGHVTFTGRVPHDEVARYLSLVDIAPFPRLPLPVCEAISPIKPFESMAMGKAVVSSSVAALTEIVDDGRTGLVFEKGSAPDLARALGVLADDPDLRGRLGDAARTWVRAERDWSRIVQIVDDVYAELTGTTTNHGVLQPASESSPAAKASAGTPATRPEDGS